MRETMNAKLSASTKRRSIATGTLARLGAILSLAVVLFRGAYAQIPAFNLYYSYGDPPAEKGLIRLPDGASNDFGISPLKLPSYCPSGNLGPFSVSVVQGTFPSGMAITGGYIMGAPHGAGEYRLTIKFSGLVCDGAPLPDEVSALRIVITSVGGGSVPIAQSNFFTHAFYTPATGKVGYHLSSEPRFYVNDIPNQCTPAWSGADITSGALPPGLNPPVMGAPNTPAGVIEGTPTQPGDWQFIVTLHHVSCYNSADHADYGDKTISVQFHVDGDAPRGVN